MRKYWCVVLVFMLAVFWGVKTYGEENKEEVITEQKAVQNEEQPGEKKEEQKQEQKVDQKEEPKAEKKEALTLEQVVVEEEKGFGAKNATLGPLGSRKILNTPYSINILPSGLIENQQAANFKEMIKYLPSVQLEERGGADVGRPQTRGFEGSVSENNRMDGMNIAVTTAYPMEQFERIEVLNGLSGSLYGPANPSGVFNFVLKRPTDTPLYQLNFSYITQNNFGGHADLGDRFGKNDIFGYRVNLLYASGEGYVDRSNLRRKLASVALDWRIFSHTVLEMNYSYYRFNLEGYPGGFSYAANIMLPNALNPTRIGYGQEWAGHDLTTNTASFRIKHDFNENWHLTFGFLDQVANRDMFTVSNTLTNNNGNYRTTFQPSSSAWEVDSDLLYLNGRVKTGSFTHDLSLGTNGHERRMMSAKTSMAQTILGTANIYNPVSYDEPAWWVNSHRYKASVSREQALIVADTITFKSWSAMLSASQSWLRARSYNTSHRTTSKYDDNGISPAVSLMYKPLENMTAYITYADSLQQGGTAPSTGVANPNETLAPYRSEQWEAGFKVALTKMNLSGAVFRIERPFPYTGTDNVFKVQGDQVNYGLELMATGEIIDRVTIYSGVTLLNPKLKDTGRPTTTNKQVVGVPKTQANLLIEYRMPYITGLALNLNYHYTGRRPANDTNTSWADAYNTIDIGARYIAKIKGVETTWRFTVKNLTNERYWGSVFPGSIDGTGASCTAFLGQPREILASVQFNF